jgi:hypothetical protein
MKIQPFNLEIIDTCLFFKTRHGQYQETGPFRDQAHLLKQITVVNKRLDSAHFTLNWSPVERNPEQQSEYFKNKNSLHASSA